MKRFASMPNVVYLVVVCISSARFVYAAPLAETLAAIAKKLPSGKGEFESSADYRMRVKHVIGETHVFMGEPTSISYDADAEIFTINPETKDQQKCEAHGTFIAKTAMNVKFKVTKANCENYQIYVNNPEQMLELIEIHSPRKSAAKWKDDLRIRYEISISQDLNGDPVSQKVSFFKTSIDEPLEGFSRSFLIFVVVDRVEVIRSSTREVVFSRERKKQEELTLAQENERKRLELQRADAARKQEEEQIKLEQKAMDQAWPAGDRDAFDAKCRASNALAVEQGRPLCACLETQMFKRFRSDVAKSKPDVNALKRMRFECMLKTEGAHEITDPAIFIASSSPKNNWGELGGRGYIRDCVSQLTAQYGPRRTPEQIQYACECVAWTLQESYPLAEYLEDIEQGRDEVIVQNTSADCKRHRPRSLGADPAP